MNEEIKNRIKGYTFLFITLVCYALCAFVLKYLYKGQENHYNGALFVAYFSNALYILYGLPLIVRAMSSKTEPGNSPLIQQNSQPALSKKEIFSISMILEPMSVAASYFFSLSMRFTSVVSTYVILDTSTAFVFLFSLLLLKAAYTNMRFFAVLVSIVGIVFVACSDFGEVHQEAPIRGDFFSFMSTIAYAISLVLIKRYVDNPDSIDWVFYYFSMGAITIVAWIPVLVFFHYTGIERFMWPDLKSWGLMFVNGFFVNVVSNYTLSLATVLLDPLIADFGLGGITPLTMVIDYFVEGKTYDLYYVLGYILVFGSFLLIVYEDWYNELPKAIEETKCKELKCFDSQSDISSEEHQ